MSKKKKPSKKIEKPIESTPDFSKLELILKQHIIFWLLVFPPVAIYKLIKHKIINKTAAIVLVTALLILLGLTTYSVLNPNLTIDAAINKQMEQMDYGKTREIDHFGQYEEFVLAEVITTKGYYAVYYEVTKSGQIEINTIIELKSDMNNQLKYNEFCLKYQKENAPSVLGKINPAAIKFIISNPDFGVVEDVLEDVTQEQVLKTSKGTYKFKYQYYETINIQELKNDEYVTVMNRDYIVQFRDDFKKALNEKKAIKQYYEVSEIITYGIAEDSIYYIFLNFCGNMYRISKYNDGRIDLEVAVGENPIAQEDLAAAWEAYQASKNVQ